MAQTIFASEQELLDNLKRGGWQIVGRNPHMVIDVVTDSRTGQTTRTSKPDGNVVWSIVGPDGDPDEIVVGISGTGGPSSDYRYSVVEGPKKAIPAESKPQPDWQSKGEWQTQPDGSKVFKGYNPTTKQWEPIPGVAAVPASEKDKPEPKTYEQNGVVYERQSDGTWAPAKGIPAQPQKADAPVFKEFEGKVYVWKPDPSKAGGGTFELAGGLGEGAHPPGFFIEGGYKVYKTWNEGTKKYEVDSSVSPEAWSPAAKAEEAKTAAQPKENDTRKNIVGGFNVTQTYKGGEWTTTSVGERATPRDIQTLTPSTEAPYIVQTDDQGKPVTIANPNYQGPKAPTTRGELAQRVALLQTQAAQMKDKIYADKSIPPDQQSARFLSWWDQNIAPQVQALDQQQQAIIADEGQKAIESQQKNLTAAANAMQGMAPYRVGPGYGQAFESLVQGTANTKFPGVENKPINLGTGWSTYKAPNIDESVQQVLNARTEVQPGMDFNELLNRNQWVPGGPPPPAAPGAPPAPGPTPEQLAAAGANPANMPFGAIGSNPMLAAMQARNRALASQQTAAATAQAGSPFGALNSMPRAAAMPMASGAGPLAYNPGAFSGVMPFLPGFDYSQVGSQWQPPY